MKPCSLVIGISLATLASFTVVSALIQSPDFPMAPLPAITIGPIMNKRADDSSDCNSGDTACVSCIQAFSSYDACEQLNTASEEGFVAACLCYEFSSDSSTYIGGDFDQPFSYCPSYFSTFDPSETAIVSSLLGYCSGVSSILAETTSGGGGGGSGITASAGASHTFSTSPATATATAGASILTIEPTSSAATGLATATASASVLTIEPIASATTGLSAFGLAHASSTSTSTSATSTGNAASKYTFSAWGLLLTNILIFL